MTPIHLPLVALVGRPNVGKSTLFNRLVGTRASIVADTPGVTRDRLFGELRHEGRVVRLVDTGGFESVAKEGSLLAQVKEQTQLAIDEADLVLLIVDSSSGVNPTDSELLGLLRRAAKPFFVVANKLDDPKHDLRLDDLAASGLGDVVPVSAEHGRGVGELCDLIVGRLNPPEFTAVVQEYGPLEVKQNSSNHPSTTSGEIVWAGGPISVALIGRPNTGKSSLVNRLVGENRVLESPVAGTTRDAVDSHIVHAGQPYILTDTAGIRRQRSIAERLEQYAVMVALRSLDRADVAVVVVDASVPPSDQDAKVAALANDRGKGVIVALNKWDLCADDKAGRQFVADLREKFGFLAYAPFIRLSAKTGFGVKGLWSKILSTQQERHRRIGTSELNRFLEKVLVSHPPPIRRGKRPRLYYVSQPQVRPPTFVFSASYAEDFPEDYVRYLTHALRDHYGFAGTPIWVKVRSRKKR